MRRMEQRHSSSAAAPEPPMPPVADVDGGGGSGGFATAVGALSAREEGILGVVFGDGLGEVRRDVPRRKAEEQPNVTPQQRLQQEREKDDDEDRTVERNQEKS